jgi:capsular exopolysaccharide synthesis family protein
MYAINDKNIESKRTKDFIDNRIVLISQELGDVETQKAQYKSSNNIVDLPTEGKINLQLKEQTRSRVLDLNTQIELNDILDNFLKSKDNTEVLPVNVGLDNEAAARNIQEYNAIVLRRNKLLENATNDNPLVKELDNDIREIKSSLNEGLKKNRTSLQISRDRVLGELGSSQGNIAKIPSQEKLFRSIERQQQIKENLYLLLLQKREEAAISMEVTAEKARVIDKAYVLKKPVAPKKLMILGLAIVIGALIPFCIIYLLQLLSKKIVNRKDMEKSSKIPVIGEIPRLRKSENHLIQNNDLSPMAEAFRILVTNLKFLLHNKTSAKKIMVTSTIKGEGKTFVSVNLGLVLAASGKKVLIIGSDIRNPQLQRYKPEMKLAKGLTEFLYGEINDAKMIAYPSDFHTNCDFIYSGSIPPNPADLLENGRYKILIDSLEDQYDYIIMDTAPLMLVTDSYLIADLADATVYITRSEYSEKEFLEYANSSFEEGKIKNVSFVLNDISAENLGYGNKYGYGYHADNKKWWHFKK